MNTFKEYRPFLHWAPAALLAVTVLLGCLVGRYDKGNGAKWTDIVATAVCILATVQPTPLALGAAGIVTGITLESLRSFNAREIPALEGRTMTLKAQIVDSRQILYGRSLFGMRVSGVPGLEPAPVDFHLWVDLPQGALEDNRGEVLVRATLKVNDKGFLPRSVLGGSAADGLLMIEKEGSRITRGRKKVIRTISDSGKHNSSGLLKAVSLGQRCEVGARARDILRKTGMYHLLAISGVHVGSAILPFLLFLRSGICIYRRMDPRTVRLIFMTLSICAVSVYLSFTGTSTSAMRAVIYFILTGSALIAGRKSSPVVSLSWCVMIIVCFGPGRQPDVPLMLSALAVTGITLSNRGGLNVFKSTLRMVLGAILFTLPVAVWLAGGIPIIAPLANILAGIPFGLILIPLAVLLDLVALFPAVPLQQIAGIWLGLADLVLGIMAILADQYFSFLYLTGPGCLLASLAAVTGLSVWWRKGFGIKTGAMVFLSIIIVSGIGMLITERVGQKDLYIFFPGIGQADAAVIKHQGRTVLIDCGPPAAPGLDSPVARALQHLGIGRIDDLFLTHHHPDHIGGLDDIITRWPIGNLYVPEGYAEDPGKDEIVGQVRKFPQVRYLQYGDIVRSALLEFMVLGPRKGELTDPDINRRSLQLLMHMGPVTALFTGDAGWDQVKRSLDLIQDLSLLKVPHHGSKTGFPPEGLSDALKRVKGKNGFIAVCPSNPPGKNHLPSSKVVDWFGIRGLKLDFTGDNGVKIRYSMADS